MRVLISIDMEGIAGVSGRADVTPGTPSYERFRHWMTQEANAVVAGAFAGGATSVVVNDSHDGMRNVLYTELDDRAELISGYNKPLNMVQGADGADAAMFVGYHARAGTPNAAFDHTKAGSMTAYWWLNGEPVGELELNAALAGHFGLPVVLVSGDDKLAEQVATILPGARRVIVKEAIDELAARSFPRRQVLGELRAAASAGLAARSEIPPVRRAGTQTLRIEFTKTGFAHSAARWPTARRVGPRTVEIDGDDIRSAFVAAHATMDLARAAER